MAYLLDTNIVSDLVRNPQGMVAANIMRRSDQTIAVSIIVAAELRFGAVRKGSRRLTAQLEGILSRFEILPIGDPIDRIYADVRSTLEKKGLMIGPNDLFIAAHALALGCVLVTDNEREFARVAELAVENWLR